MENPRLGPIILIGPIVPLTETYDQHWLKEVEEAGTIRLQNVMGTRLSDEVDVRLVSVMRRNSMRYNKLLKSQEIRPI
jgi:hypothetical protein